MIREVKGFALLDGYRGRRRDVEALAEVIVRLANLADHLPGVVEEVEINNPLFVLPEGRGTLAGDGLIVLKQQ